MISKNNHNLYDIEISDKIKNIVILNKIFRNKDIWGSEKNIIASSQKKPGVSLLLKLINYIEWLGKLKDELFDFYNQSSFFEGKLYDVGQEWFDRLTVFDFAIDIDNNENFEAFITLLDYLQNDYGFHLEIENKKIINIEYNPDL